MSEKNKSNENLNRRFQTTSFREVEPLYSQTPGKRSVREDFPGEFPYTRGISPTAYRGKLWTMRQTAGFSSPNETNKHFRYLISQGQTGLSVAYDLPTLMGLDANSAFAAGEVGKCGVSVSSLADFESLFEDIDLEKVTVAQTINAPAWIFLAFFVALAEKRGFSLSKISGTLQNDILKEYIAQNEWIYPIKHSMKIVTDTLEYCAINMPKYNPISVSGYHIREAGSTAIQEIAITLRNGVEYLLHGISRGLDVDELAPRFSFFFDAHNDFFEEIAKFRAARIVWARLLKQRFGSKNPRSMKLRFHTQTAGVSLTSQQPRNNIARVAIQALAAVLGGTQSLHTDGYDEALGLPTNESVTVALRTQQIIAEEIGVVNTVDPLGGCWFIESLTQQMVEECFDYFDRIDRLGGMINAIESGIPQLEVQESAYRYQKAVEEREQIVVGVNKYVLQEDGGYVKPAVFAVAPEVQELRIRNLRETKNQRDSGQVERKLQDLRDAAKCGENLMYTTIKAAKSYCTVEEICNALRDVYGEYKEPRI